MFPIAFAAGSIHDRTLKADDLAGITEIYGTSAARRSHGSISGRVTKSGGGVFGAHVVAFSTRTGALVGGMTLNDEGGYTIAGWHRGLTCFASSRWTTATSTASSTRTPTSTSTSRCSSTMASSSSPAAAASVMSTSR